jgi:hypothetical protein
MQGIVMLHSGETAGVRTRASAMEDNAQSAATAVTALIKIFSSGDFASGRPRTAHRPDRNNVKAAET